MKNGIRNAKFSIIIHDVCPETSKQICEAWVLTKKPIWSLVAREEYNHQEGFHIHIFLEFPAKNPYAWNPLLKELQRLFPEVNPDGSRKSHIKMKHGKGSFDDCENYLQGHTKKKHIDESITVDLSYAEISRQLDAYKETLFDYDLSLVENIRQYLSPEVPPHLFAQYEKKRQNRLIQGEKLLMEMNERRKQRGPIVLTKELLDKKVRKCRLLDLVSDICDLPK